jgi:hypothetical protein
MMTAGTGVCLLTPHICPFTHCIFLLTPCISSLARLTQELLPWHGARYVLSPEAFSYPSFPLQCSRTSKTIRKIVLVESRHTAKTVEFLNRISTLELKKPSGEKEWVEVYDYRLLEMVAKVDRNIDREPGYNPWGKCWIGAV